MRFALLNGQLSFLKLCLFHLVVSVLAVSTDSVLAVDGRIAFTSYRDNGKSKIYIMDSDGGRRFELAEGYQPAWLPDGEKIGFHYRNDVWVINANGTNRVNITKGINSHSKQCPSWSPNGRKIAYVEHDGQDWDIYVMDSDGTDPRNISRDKRQNWKPSWSPYGNRISFGTWMNPWGADRLESDIFVMNADGADLINLTKNPRANNSSPSWSPDGKKIAYRASPKPFLWLPPYNIYLMNADGTNPTILTKQDRWTYEWNPAWSPDSRKLAFVKYTLDGYKDIFTINADGSGLQNITQTDKEYEGNPVWSPAPLAVSSSERMVTRWGAVKQGEKLLHTSNESDPLPVASGQ
ncbi:MAG: hypothetical protein OXN17_20345 [Candidatus Poribacteria bacterium]|nr:hypothetical protein [Candidatus Poribacteria bacterium]MDE0504847.1 hypothetical protein [Candidatus Poribacteria bacterium]